MKISFHLSLLAWVLVISSCDKSHGCENGLAAPEITSNSPVTAGDTVELSVPYVENAYYSWFAPHQEYGDSNIIRFPAYDTYLSGNYKVQYLTTDCASDLASIDIVVNPVTSPCSYQTNHAEVLTYHPSITFSNSYLYVSSDSDSYSLQADGSWSDDYIYVHFAANSKPKNGVYTLTSYYYPEPGEAYVNFKLSNDYWKLYNGKIYVSTINGKLSATWCNVPISRSWDGLTSVSSGNLTEQ